MCMLCLFVVVLYFFCCVSSVFVIVFCLVDHVCVSLWPLGYHLGCFVLHFWVNSAVPSQ